VRRTTPEAEEACRAWNEAHPVGTSVLYTPYAGYEGAHIRWTRTTAFVFGRDQPACGIAGFAGTVMLSQLQPMPGIARPSYAARLLCSADAFRLILHINPLVASYRLAVHCVGRRWLNPHAPNFPVLSLDVLERKLYFGALLQAESIQQGSDALRRDDALYVTFRMRENAELSPQFIRSCEFAELGRRRRRRWR
jgi:hypothetical protein